MGNIVSDVNLNAVDSVDSLVPGAQQDTNAGATYLLHSQNHHTIPCPGLLLVSIVKIAHLPNESFIKKTLTKSNTDIILIVEALPSTKCAFLRHQTLDALKTTSEIFRANRTQELDLSI